MPWWFGIVITFSDIYLNISNYEIIIDSIDQIMPAGGGNGKEANVPGGMTPEV